LWTLPTAIITALVVGAIYLAIGLLWHLINFYTDGAVSYYGSIFFFLIHFLGLIFVKTFYVYHMAEPSYVKHMVAIFIIAVNALAVVLAVFAFIKSDKTIVVWILTVIAVLFGLLTIKAGGQVLFGGNSYQKAAGSYVLLVVWFNFLAGFVYLVAGAGIWMRKYWSVWLSLLIFITTVIVFAIFGLHILRGGEYETRTVAAMSLRSLVWISIYLFSYRELIRR